MCASCGCDIPDEKHGDERNITWNEVVEAAKANDMSPEQVAASIHEMSRKQASKT